MKMVNIRKLILASVPFLICLSTTGVDATKDAVMTDHIDAIYLDTMLTGNEKSDKTLLESYQKERHQGNMTGPLIYPIKPEANGKPDVPANGGGKEISWKRIVIVTVLVIVSLAVIAGITWGIKKARGKSQDPISATLPEPAPAQQPVPPQTVPVPPATPAPATPEPAQQASPPPPPPAPAPPAPVSAPAPPPPVPVPAAAPVTPAPAAVPQQQAVQPASSGFNAAKPAAAAGMTGAAAGGAVAPKTYRNVTQG
jgi:hypothetical protein